MWVKWEAKYGKWLRNSIWMELKLRDGIQAISGDPIMEEAFEVLTYLRPRGIQG